MEKCCGHGQVLAGQIAGEEQRLGHKLEHLAPRTSWVLEAAMLEAGALPLLGQV